MRGRCRPHGLRALLAVAVVTLVTSAAPVGASERACEPHATPLLVTDQRLFRHDGSLVADVVVANVAHGVIQHVDVSVEFYDFFGGLLRAERTVLTPLVLQPTHRATFRVATPFTQGARTVAYRFTGVRDARAFQSVVVCDAAL